MQKLAKTTNCVFAHKEPSPVTPSPDQSPKSNTGPPASGWFWVDNAVVDRLQKLSGPAVKTYLVLAKCAGEERTCFPGIDFLGRSIGVSRPTVKRAIAQLVEAELVEKIYRHTESGDADTNLYRLPPLGRFTSEPTPPIRSVHQRTQGRVTSEPGVGSPVNPKKDLVEKDPLEKTKRRASPDRSVPIPSELGSDEFRQVWTEWLAYRRDRKLTVTPQTLKAQLKKLAGWGTRAAIESINSSISNGWAGLFEPKNGACNVNNRTGDGPGQRHDPSRPARDPLAGLV